MVYGINTQTKPVNMIIKNVYSIFLFILKLMDYNYNVI